MRVLAHVDLDAFYTQVEAKRNPDLKGTPLVVIQYNPYGDLRTLKPSDNRLFPESNGSIIAVSYEARKHGVKRNMSAQQAKKLCPALNIVQVPVAHGKADLTIYREAGAQVINILSSRAVCERASIDEAYLDVTQEAQQLLSAAAARSSAAGRQQQQQEEEEAAAPTVGLNAAGGAAEESSATCMLLPLPDAVEGWHVAGMVPGAAAVAAWWARPADSWSPDEQLLAAGAVIVAQLRDAVAHQLGFSCSAGVAHSKILAKLGSGLNKPAQQTLVPAAAVSGLLAPLPLPKLRQLGGKFGEELMQGLGVSTVGELLAVPLSRLEALVGVDNAAWLLRLAQGEDDAEVKPRTLPKSISCGKTFRGNTALTSLTAVHNWLKQLSTELQERVESDRRDHQRLPTLLTVSIDTTAAAGAAEASATAAAVAAAAAAIAAGGSSGSGNGVGGKRATAQNWRDGVASVSRSTALRRPVADVMAEDTLKLVKKWARDRGQGWKVIGMFISASNFVAAPTGASTLHRFVAAAAAQQQQQQHAVSADQEHRQQQQQQASMNVQTATPGAAGLGNKMEQPKEVQQQQQHQQQQHNSAILSPASSQQAAAVSGTTASNTRQFNKRQLSTDAGHAGSSRHKAAKACKESSGLRAFLVAPAAATATAETAGRAAAATACSADTPAIKSISTAAADAGGGGSTTAAASNSPSLTLASPSRRPAASALSVLSVLHSNAAAAAVGASTHQQAHQQQQQEHVMQRQQEVATLQQQQQQQQQGHVMQQQQRGVTPLQQQQGNAMQQQQQEVATLLQQQQQQGALQLAEAESAAEGHFPAEIPLLTEYEPEVVAVLSQQQQQQSTPSQPSQVVVSSLRGWMDASQQQAQQQQQQYSDIDLAPQVQQPQQQLFQQLDGTNSAIEDMKINEGPAAASTAAAAVVPPAQMIAGSSTSSRNTNWQRPPLRLSDMDPEVLAELPIEIQLELRRAAAAGNRSSSNAAGSSRQSVKHGKQVKNGKRQQGVQEGSICKYLARKG